MAPLFPGANGWSELIFLILVVKERTTLLSLEPCSRPLGIGVVRYGEQSVRGGRSTSIDPCQAVCTVRAATTPCSRRSRCSARNMIGLVPAGITAADHRFCCRRYTWIARHP